MDFHRYRVQDAALGLAYFAAASVALCLTRFDGGVAFLWVAGSLLTAAVTHRQLRNWGGAFLACGIGSFVATGLFGLGWAMALPFALLNLAEAYAGARLFRRFGHSRTPLGSMRWLGHFMLSFGVVGPAVGAVLAALTLASVGKAPLPILVNVYVGHALGALCFIPIVNLVISGKIREKWVARDRTRAEVALLLALTIATTLVVFAQSRMPLLFLPMLPVILITFRWGETGAALAVMLLAVIGGGMTLAGFGPIQLFHARLGEQLQFLQFYLASTVITVLPVAADLRTRSRLHREVRLSEARYRLLADHSSDILLHLAVSGRVRFVSPSIRQLGGYDPERLIGYNSSDLVAPEHRVQVREAHRATLAAMGKTCTFDYLALTQSGEKRWFETHSRAVVDEDGAIEGVMSIVRDVTNRKLREIQLAADALTDVLTGLPNRRAFRAAVEARGGARNRDCLAMIDIDHFKRVNDSHGHDGGDEVLRSFARVARRHMRQNDVVARIGGEEFAILLSDTTTEQAALICDRLRQEMAATVTPFAGQQIAVTISGGVAPLGDGGVDFALRVADSALYRAKMNGRDQLALAA